MKKVCLLVILLCGAGCIPLPFVAGVQVVSTAISLGQIGQTVIKMASATPGSMPVGLLPAQYSDNPERMLREAWEQNYQLAKIIRWEGEDSPWQEVVASTTRKGESNGAAFALVERRPARTETRLEETTVYTTATGRVIADLAQSFDESYYAQSTVRSVDVPWYTYSAWVFTRSRQPSGILAANSQKERACNAPPGSGSLILAVGKNTPAYKAALRTGDVILRVNGQPSPYSALFTLLHQGENTLQLCRNGQKTESTLSLPVPQRVLQNPQETHSPAHGE